MLTNNFILAISGRNTLRPLGIQFRPFANSVQYIKYCNHYSLGTAYDKCCTFYILKLAQNLVGISKQDFRNLKDSLLTPQILR
jgi:hypothetical protein